MTLGTKTGFKTAFLAVVLASGLAACGGGVRPMPGETVGETFRKVMAQIDAKCRQEKKGPYLDPKDPEYKEKRRYTDCDILKLLPEDPLSTPEGRFAHSIKLPAPHDEPKDVWRPGMTGEEYFQALCEAEAGEWIFRTVEGVEGVRQVRPYHKTNFYESLGTYLAAEIAVGEIVAHVDNPAGYLVSSGVKQWRTYQYLEIPISENYGSDNYSRHIKSLDVPQVPPVYGVAVINHVTPQSRYGYVWRGIERDRARENGILGSELLVLDLDSKEVLGYRRHFYRMYFDQNYLTSRQMFAGICKRKHFDSGFAFITRVVRPTMGGVQK